jgi:hypothetical protein
LVLFFVDESARTHRSGVDRGRVLEEIITSPSF